MVWPFLKGDDMSTPDAKEHWEEHYGERDRVWSGRVNAAFAEIVEPLKPGTALDLGCGEGGDAMWLGEHGWQVVAVDISETALQRAAEDADVRGVGNRIEFQSHDLSEGFPEGAFDLVSAQFLHSTLPLDRTRIFQQAADAIRPGGLLLIVDHGGAPPWASKLHHHHEFPSADEVVAAIDLPEPQWETLRAGPVEREATGPNGEAGTLVDNVIVLRRLTR
jgi:SAM-dependent methyltransferase